MAAMEMSCQCISSWCKYGLRQPARDDFVHSASVLCDPTWSSWGNTLEYRGCFDLTVLLKTPGKPNAVVEIFFSFQITQLHTRWLSRGDRTRHRSELDDSVPVPAQPSKRGVNLWSYLGWYVNCLSQHVQRVTVRRHQRSKAAWAVILLNLKDIRNNEVKWKVFYIQFQEHFGSISHVAMWTEKERGIVTSQGWHLT